MALRADRQTGRSRTEALAVVSSCTLRGPGTCAAGGQRAGGPRLSVARGSWKVHLYAEELDHVCTPSRAQTAPLPCSELALVLEQSMALCQEPQVFLLPAGLASSSSSSSESSSSNSSRGSREVSSTRCIASCSVQTRKDDSGAHHCEHVVAIHPAQARSIGKQQLHIPLLDMIVRIVTKQSSPCCSGLAVQLDCRLPNKALKSYGSASLLRCATTGDIGWVS